MLLFNILVFLILLVGVLMSIVVLLQSGKGGGLAGIASGGQTTQILGARQAPDFLEKATWTLGTSFLVLCVLTTFAIPRDGTGNSILQERADELPASAPAPTAPGAPGTALPGATAPAEGSAPAGSAPAAPAPAAPAGE